MLYYQNQIWLFFSNLSSTKAQFYGIIQVVAQTVVTRCHVSKEYKRANSLR